MKLLLDTHTLLWHAEGDPRMSATAIARYEQLPFPDRLHRDPFDCMIVIHAVGNGLAVVGVDAAFDPYGISRLW